MSRYEVTLDVSQCTGETWDRWCEQEKIAGIEYGAVQLDGLEHWTVTADDHAQAADHAETAIGDYPVTVHAVVEVQS